MWVLVLRYDTHLYENCSTMSTNGGNKSKIGYRFCYCTCHRKNISTFLSDSLSVRPRTAQLTCRPLPPVTPACHQSRVVLFPWNPFTVFTSDQLTWTTVMQSSVLARVTGYFLFCVLVVGSTMWSTAAQHINDINILKQPSHFFQLLAVFVSRWSISSSCKNIAAGRTVKKDALCCLLDNKERATRPNCIPPSKKDFCCNLHNENRKWLGGIYYSAFVSLISVISVAVN